MLREEAERIARELFAAFPDTPLRDDTPTVYIKLLEKLDYAAVEPLVAELIETSPSLPKIYDVRRRVHEVELAIPSPLEAYRSLFEGASERHPLTQYVADLFGGDWNVRNSDTPAATRAQFLKYYEELREEALSRGSLPRAVVEAAERAEAAQPDPPKPLSVWTPIRERFDALSDEERAARLNDARTLLLDERGLSPEWVTPLVIENEALRIFADENSWIDREAS